MLGHMVQVFRKIISDTNKQFKLVLYCNYRPFHFEIKKLIKNKLLFCLYVFRQQLITYHQPRQKIQVVIYIFLSKTAFITFFIRYCTGKPAARYDI